MIVVFDSNIWLSELGLRSGPGAATRFFLKHIGARVAVPEVIRLEVAHNLRSKLLKHIDSIQTDYRQLLTTFGTLHEIVLPGPEQVESRIDELFASLNVEQVDVPFSLESARNSFLKTIKKVPPSHSSQQFKDGVIWADCLAMLEVDDVILVTGDKAFYKDQHYSKGLAQELVEEASTRPNKIRVLPELSELLQAVQSTVAVDIDALQAAFLDAHRDSVIGTLERQGFELGTRVRSTYSLFATDNATALFIDFKLSLSCTDARGEGRSDIEMHLKGDGNYAPGNGSFSNLRNFGEHLQYRQPDGSVAESRNYVGFVDGIVVGHKQVTHRTRYPLPQNDP